MSCLNPNEDNINVNDLEEDDENVEISERERSALLPVVSMHCLVLYCYLLASTKRGNESEGVKATWPAGQS